MSDLPDFYLRVVEEAVEAGSFAGGADAAKPASPVSKDIYLATDTKILYICVADGSWTGFDFAMLVQGILTLYADVAGGGFEIKNIKDPTAAQSAATRAYVLAQLANYLLLTGGTMSGAIAMGANKITGLGAPAADGDAATRAYADTKLANVVEDLTPQLGGNLDCNSKNIVGLLTVPSDVTASRLKNTTYTNSGSRPLLVIITVDLDDSEYAYLQIHATADPPTTLASAGLNDTGYGTIELPLTALVPVGWKYSLSSTGTVYCWHEVAIG